jgi:hypothetical protein
MATEPLIIERTDPPVSIEDQMTGPGSMSGRVEPIWSDSAAFDFAVPSMFRVLASPLSGQSFPRAPQRGDPNWFSYGYWSSLVHMLVYSLGWARPDRGLWWWYQNGKPTNDLRLQVLAEVFDRDGQLDWFAALLWSREYLSIVGSGFDQGFDHYTGWTDSGEVLPVDRTWIDRMRSEATASGICHPHVAALGGMHLQFHCDKPLRLSQGRSSSLMLHTDPDRRRAVLVLDSMTGWYANLCELGKTLPPMKDRSWHVDVIVEPVGWLGMYRRSRVTNLWFSGQHRFHTPGA